MQGTVEPASRNKISKKDMPLYVAEFQFRYNSRLNSDVLGVLFSWSGPYAHAQDEQTKHPPSTQDTEQKVAKEAEGQGKGWRKYKEKIESNEKLITAISTIFIAAFTVLLAFATFFLWSATRDLVDDAKHNAERQLRAYVFIESVEMITVGRIVRAVLSIKNFGQTPAYDLIVYIGMSSRGASDVFVPPRPDDIELDKLPVGPGMSISTSNQFEVPADNNDLLPALDHGQAVVYVYGRVDYVDAFKVPRYLIFRQRAAKLSNGSWQAKATPEGNTAN
jgi:hypothetical protein